jgi:hypothetical protein
MILGVWGIEAQPKERPMLRNFIHQLEGIKYRPNRAPSNCGGHKAVANESNNPAGNELDPAMPFDRK